MRKQSWYAVSLLLIVILSTSTIYSVRAPTPIRRWIKGQVLDSKTSRPIFRAEVVVYSKNKAVSRTAFTNESGNFAVTTNTGGIYDVRVSHKYYLDKRYRNIKVPDSGTISLKKIWIIGQPNYEELVRKDSIVRSARLEKRQKPPTGVSLIAGRVLEKNSLEPIILARVRLLLPDGRSTKRGELTNADGDFIIQNIPPGIYQVEISYGPVYVKQVFKDVKVQNRKPTDLGIIFLIETSSMPDTVFVTSVQNRQVF